MNFCVRIFLCVFDRNSYLLYVALIFMRLDMLLLFFFVVHFSFSTF